MTGPLFLLLPNNRHVEAVSFEADVMFRTDVTLLDIRSPVQEEFARQRSLSCMSKVVNFVLLPVRERVFSKANPLCNKVHCFV